MDTHTHHVCTHTLWSVKPQLRLHPRPAPQRYACSVRIHTRTMYLLHTVWSVSVPSITPTPAPAPSAAATVVLPQQEVAAGV